jgi:hypothetical protein
LKTGCGTGRRRSGSDISGDSGLCVYVRPFPDRPSFVDSTVEGRGDRSVAAAARSN